MWLQTLTIDEGRYVYRRESNVGVLESANATQVGFYTDRQSCTKFGSFAKNNCPISSHIPSVPSLSVPTCLDFARLPLAAAWVLDHIMVSSRGKTCEKLPQVVDAIKSNVKNDPNHTTSIALFEISTAALWHGEQWSYNEGKY